MLASFHYFPVYKTSLKASHFRVQKDWLYVITLITNSISKVCAGGSFIVSHWTCDGNTISSHYYKNKIVVWKVFQYNYNQHVKMEADKTPETSSIWNTPQAMGSAQRNIRTITPWYMVFLEKMIVAHLCNLSFMGLAVAVWLTAGS